MTEFYTYIYYDPSRNNEPIYVGKGKGNRAWRHLNRKDTKHIFVSRLVHMRNKGVSPIIGIYGGLDEEFAFFLEQELIAKFGRKNIGTGPLLNLTDGGEGGSGVVLSEETRYKLGQVWRGKKLYPETVKKISEALTGKTMQQQTKDKISKANKGRVQSEEHKRKVSASMTGRVVSEETKKNISKALTGRTLSEEHIRKVSEGNKGKVFSEETKKKLSEAAKGRVMSESAKESLRRAWAKRKEDKLCPPSD